MVSKSMGLVKSLRNTHDCRSCLRDGGKQWCKMLIRISRGKVVNRVAETPFLARVEGAMAVLDLLMSAR